MSQDLRNPQQHLGIDALPLENIVDVGALAAKMLREPAYRVFLTPEFRLDQPADMYHAVSKQGRGPTPHPRPRLWNAHKAG